MSTLKEIKNLSLAQRPYICIDTFTAAGNLINEIEVEKLEAFNLGKKCGAESVCAPPGTKCIVKDCTNRVGQGPFRGTLCDPCYHHVQEHPVKSFCRGELPSSESSLRKLQTTLPWTIKYSQDYRSNPQPHKDFTHALVHVAKALGKLMGLADDMDHDRTTALQSGLAAAYSKYIADLVVCALRAANTFPGGKVDLQREVEHRIESKNEQTPSSVIPLTHSNVWWVHEKDRPDVVYGSVLACTEEEALKSADHHYRRTMREGGFLKKAT